ncbi:MAG: TetR/AcrR family transcriptional regulator [Acidimicrobiia bacterium]
MRYMATSKERLTQTLILEAAVGLADEHGLEAFTMRKLADVLGTAPMTLYHHIPSKEAIIDGIVELVFAEIELPPEDLDWKTAIRRRCVSARAVLNRHPWAAPLMESGPSPGPANLRHHDAVIGCLRRGGLSIALTAHAYAVLDSFIYGFAFEEATLPGAGAGEDLPKAAAEIAASMPFDEYPHLAELAIEHVLQPGYDFGDSFEFGLDLIIEGIDQASRHQRARTDDDSELAVWLL